MDLGLAGKTAIVTGGGTGLGRAIAAALLREGAQVTIAGRRADVLERAAAELASLGPVLAVPTDVRDPSQATQLAARTEARFGGIHILVNNAGASMPSAWDEMDEAAWRAVLDGKFYGFVWCIRAVLPAMRRVGWGRIVNISGLFGHEPTPTNVAQGVSLAAVANLTKTLGQTLARENILVTAVCPGPFETERHQATVARTARLRGISEAEVRAARLASVPIGRLGRPEELADVVAFLASERASYITGSTVYVDGGERRGI
ncbi:MAG: SDR family oxidoreductase [Chloroflexi bacterium]|nr:SDR family oxidoreductase [Chloroflexota bacterium]